MPKDIRIIIAEHHRSLLDDLVAALEDYDDITVAVTVLTFANLFLQLKKHIADVLLYGFSIISTEGIRAVKKIRNDFPHVKVLVLVLDETDEYVERLMDSDVDGSELKDADRDDLIRAIHKVHGGEKHFSQATRDKFFKISLAKRAQGKRAHFTDREIEVLRHLTEGKDRQAIATLLNISIHTVDGHLSNMFAKLGVHSELQLVVKAKKDGYLK